MIPEIEYASLVPFDITNLTWECPELKNVCYALKEHILMKLRVLRVLLVSLVLISRIQVPRHVYDVRQVRTQHQMGCHLAGHVMMVRCNQICKVLVVTRVRKEPSPS